MLKHCEALAEFAVGLRWQDVPERVRRKARAQVLAVLGALYGSAGNDDARIVSESLAERVGDGPVRIPGGPRAQVEDALLATASATMALDFDDYVFAGHTGHSAVLVPLLLGAAQGASGREALVAQIVANEVGARLGAAMLVGPLNGQMWAPIHAAAAACAAARLLGLDAARTADALGIALAAPPMPLMPGFMGSGAKVLTAALPAWMGLTAARLAARGMRGARDAIEGRGGLLDRFAYAPAPFFLSGLGQAWLTDTIAYKVYPGCAYIGSTIDALLQILAEHPLAADDVDRVDVRASIVTVGMQRLSVAHAPAGPLSPVNINFSIPLNVALVLHHGRLDPRVLETAALARAEPQLRALAARVHLTHDWSMTVALGAALERSLHIRRVLPQLDLRGLLRARRELAGDLELPDARALGAILHDLRGPVLAAGRRALAPRGARRDRPAPAAGYDLGRTGEDLASFTFPFAAHVAVRTRAGRVHEALVERPLGTPGDWEASFRWTEEKLRREARAARPDSQPDRIVDIVQRYEDHTAAELLDAL